MEKNPTQYKNNSEKHFVATEVNLFYFIFIKAYF